MSDSCTCSTGAQSKPHAYHRLTCPMRNHPESVLAMLKSEQQWRAHAEKGREFWSTQAKVWEGKFHAVKRENNKLRKKLYPGKG